MGDRLATIDMGRKLGGSAPFLGRGAGSPQCRLRQGPTSVPSGIFLIHPSLWPQYTNVTDGQDRQTDRTDGQTTDRLHRMNRFTNGGPKNRFNDLFLQN